MPRKPAKRIEYSPGKGEEICELLAEGMSLNQICKRDDMPSRSKVHNWLNVHEKFRERYLLAKGLGIDQMVEEMLEISDDGSGDLIENADGHLVSNSTKVQRDRLRVDTRKWYAARLAPKVYGDTTVHEHKNAEGQELKVTIEPGEAVRRILFAINLGKKLDEEMIKEPKDV